MCGIFACWPAKLASVSLSLTAMLPSYSFVECHNSSSLSCFVACRDVLLGIFVKEKIWTTLLLTSMPRRSITLVCYFQPDSVVLAACSPQPCTRLAEGAKTCIAAKPCIAAAFCRIWS